MTLALGLVVLGAAVVLVGAGRSGDAPPGVPVAPGTSSGTGAATALALVALAGVGASLLVRRWARTVLGVVLLGVAAATISAGLTPTRWAALVGGALMGLGGARHRRARARAGRSRAGATRRPPARRPAAPGTPGTRWTAGRTPRPDRAWHNLPSTDPEHAPVRAAEDVAMSASHGNTPAAWTAVSIMFVGFLISGIALPLELEWLFFVGLVVVVLGAVVGKVMSMMGMGSTVTYKDERDPEYDDQRGTA